MKRYIIYTIFILFFIFIQSTPFYGNISIQGVYPDLILISFLLVALSLGPVSGEIFGFCVGFLLDILGGGLLGITGFTYTILGYGTGLIGEKIYGRSVFFPVILLFTGTVLKAIILSLLALIFLEPGYFGFFSKGKIFLESVLNASIAPFIFIILSGIERRVVE